MPSQKSVKQPISVLVVLHDGAGNILLLERADRAGFWQSVTGSLEVGETPFQTALREVAEETGIVLAAHELHDWAMQTEYEIYPHWRHRYADGVTRNVEHWFAAKISPHQAIRLTEHTAYQWLDTVSAAERVFSPSNREAILQLAVQQG